MSTLLPEAGEDWPRAHPDPVSIQVEVLEYGKPCASPGGNIVAGSEHGFLGKSPGFPDVLVPHCDPNVVGLGVTAGQDQSEPLFAAAGHGTVLRPVVFGGKAYGLFYRSGIRREQPKSAVHVRNYRLARYLFDGSGRATPAQLFRAIGPLDGLGPAEIAGIGPMEIAAAPTPEFPEAFLRRAIEFAISGIPVQVDAEEAEFFELASAVWTRLPPSLQPLFLAGWNITRSLASRMHLSHSRLASEKCARYSAPDQSWSLPPVRQGKAFSRQELFPGFVYWRHHTGCSDRADQYFLGGEVERETGDTGALPDFVIFPDLSSDYLIPTFRREGTSWVDPQLLRALRRWLEQGDGNDHWKELAKPALSGPRRDDVPRLAIECFGQAGAAQRGVLLFWESLKFGVPGVAPDAAGDVREHPLAQLLTAVFDQEPAAALAALARCLGYPAVSALPEEQTVRLHQCLDDSLGRSDAASLHYPLLDERAPACYRQWVAAKAWQLGIALAATPERSDRLGIIEAWGTDRAGLIAILGKVAAGLPPRDEDLQALVQCGKQGDAAFADLISRKWRAFRDQVVLPAHFDMLRWTSGMSSSRFDDPLIWLFLGEHNWTAGEVRDLAEDISRGQLPAPLRSAAAKLLLDQWNAWPITADISPQHWKPVLAYWPDSAPLLLLEVDWVQTVPSPGMTDVDSPLPAAQAFHKLTKWMAPENRTDPRTPKMLAALWRWAARPRPSASVIPLFDAVVAIAEGRFPSSVVLGISDRETLQRWMLAGNVRESLRPNCRTLWDSAQHLWQIQLLLELFPDEDFIPHVAHLVALMQARKWLHAHLQGDVHRGRPGRFRIAGMEFHSASYGSDLWEPRFGQTALWGAFRDVPRAHRTHLAPVLLAYGETAAERAGLCRTFLDAQRSCDRDYALLEIFEAYLQPTLEQLPGNRGEELKAAVRSGPRSARGTRAGSLKVSLAPAGTKEAVTYVAAGNLYLIADYFLLLLWDFLQSHPEV